MTKGSKWAITQSWLKHFLLFKGNIWHCAFSTGFPMDHPTKFGEALYCFNGDLLTLFFQRWPL
jgi:hypothetical protein